MKEISWSKLETFESNKNKSFEELCFQIAKRQYSNIGVFTSIDDSGGGDGVEFYLTFENGDEWGWQAKFFNGDCRLNNSNRKPQIEKSLIKACNVHPKLKRWILCTNSNFTKDTIDKNGKNKEGEIGWFNKELPKKIPANINLELEHWGESEIIAFFSQPSFYGIKNFFFGELELDIDWFNRLFTIQFEKVKEKYDEDLHVKTSIDDILSKIMFDSNFKDKTNNLINEMFESIKELKDTIKILENNPYKEIKLDDLTEKLQTLYYEIKEELAKIYKIINNFDKKNIEDIEEIIISLNNLDLKSIKNKTYSIYDEKLDIRIDEIRSNENKYILKDFYKPNSILNQIYNQIEEIYDSIIKLNNRELHIFAKAGEGKTHVSCNICKYNLNKNLPAIFIPASTFKTEEPINTQLLKILDIPQKYSWKDFLDTIDIMASIYKTRIPIIIDGLNETTIAGGLSNLWKDELESFIKEIKCFSKNIIIITTCRTTYKEFIWGEKNISNAEYLKGFNYIQTKEAVKKYFKKYKIKADLTTTSLSHFNHPLYLKIFCQTKNPERKEEKEIYLGEESLFEIFEEFIVNTNKVIVEKNGFYKKTNIIGNLLKKVSNYLWEKQVRVIKLDEFVKLVDEKDLKELNWEKSITKILEDEGLLFIRDWEGESEFIGFSYDLIGGFLIANEIIENNKQNIDEFFKSEYIEKILFSNNYRDKHPLFEDISRALAALLPKKTGKHLYEIINKENKRGFSFSINAIFEITPNLINEKEILLIKKLFNKKENRGKLFELSKSCILNSVHPLNIDFWSIELINLSISERDLCWTNYVRTNYDYFIEVINEFEEICKEDILTSEKSKNRLDNTAKYTTWALTSNIHFIRDISTKSLYLYGLKNPEKAFNLVKNFIGINDSYIFERLLSVLCGISLNKHYDFKERESFINITLQKWAKWVYENIFAENALYSTTNIMIRDYGSLILELAYKYNKIPKEYIDMIDYKKIDPSTIKNGVIWKKDKNVLKEIENNEKAIWGYKNYVNIEFAKDPLKKISYDNKNKSILKNSIAFIVWKIKELGWTKALFAEIDSNIHKTHSFEGGKLYTETIADKYFHIAYYELAGFYRIKYKTRKLFDYQSEIEDRNIDPNFPETKKTSFNLITENLLGDTTIEDFKWIENKELIDYTPYLIVDNLMGNDGKWVLLSGYNDQRNLKKYRSTFFKGLLLKASDEKKVLNHFKKIISYEWIGSGVPEFRNLFTFEIPWSKNITQNTKNELSFLNKKNGSKKKVKTPVIYINNKKLNRDEEESFYNNLNEEEFEDNKISLIFEETIDYVDTYIDYEYYSPIIRINWGNGDYANIKDDFFFTLSKDISQEFNLIRSNSDFDLYEQNGKKASIYIHNKNSSEHYIFIRKDLFDKYILKNNYSFIWSISGEKQISELDFKIHKIEKFQDIQKYKLIN